MQECLQAWDWQGTPADPVPCGEGHINQTYLVRVDTPGAPKRYILQKINTDTFRDPDLLMENICGVTEYLRAMILRNGGDPARETLHVCPTREGKAYYRASDGGCWRVYDFVEDTVCLQSVRNAEDFCESARAFGNFQRRLARYPVKKLHETIPRFHDTPKRLADFESAVRRDPFGRAEAVRREIEFVCARRDDCRYMTDLLEAGKLPLRVTHNDTKLNNVLLDSATGDLCDRPRYSDARPCRQRFRGLYPFWRQRLRGRRAGHQQSAFQPAAVRSLYPQFPAGGGRSLDAA